MKHDNWPTIEELEKCRDESLLPDEGYLVYPKSVGELGEYDICYSYQRLDSTKKVSLSYYGKKPLGILYTALYLSGTRQWVLLENKELSFYSRKPMVIDLDEDDDDCI